MKFNKIINEAVRQLTSLPDLKTKLFRSLDLKSFLIEIIFNLFEVKTALG
jgi:hypothetical protein